MSGEEFKNILLEKGFTYARVYNELGMTSQAFNQATKCADMKSGFLERVCRVLGESMAFFYPSAYPTSVVQTFNRQQAHNIANGNGNEINECKDSEIIKELMTTIEELRQDKRELRERIAELKAQLQDGGK